MILNTIHSNMMHSPARTIQGKVELYNSSAFLQAFLSTDALKSFTVSRSGENKFFGFGVLQKIEVKLLDRERAINIEEGQLLKPGFEVSGDTVYPTPFFYVSSEITRDENTNELTIMGYDALYKAKSHTVSELGLEAPYTIKDVAIAAAAKIGLTIANNAFFNDVSFDTSYVEGANFDGAETLREVFDAIAEATQTFYYLNEDNNLVFNRLAWEVSAPNYTIDKSMYFTLESGTTHTLAAIVSATELGDNVLIEAPGITGETQYVRNNPFWELREDITNLLEAAIGVTAGMDITQFKCKWRGNYLLQPGDRIWIIGKDDQPVNSYLLDDKYTYNGGFSAESAFEYGINKNESVDNPVTLGAALKKTYAKVDKANKEIEIVAGETSVIKMTTDSIQMSVTKLDEDMSELMSEVSTKVGTEDVTFLIKTALPEGVDKVTTTTGFTFNEEGLNITKEDNEINTTITENGMTIYKEKDEILVANNLGVKAEDLHATTFLIIGNNSRLEDYNRNRTGCFWLGR